MKWPFARQPHPATAPTAGDVGSIATADPARAYPHMASAEVVAPARRDWATLPPLQVAGGRPISLTVAARAFTEGLATQQVLVRAPRLEMVRQIDAPTGSFRGVLAPSVGDHDDASAPALQESSPLPAIGHRHVAALVGEHGGGNGRSAVEQLLAIDAPGQPTASAPVAGPIDVHPTGTRDEPPEGGPSAGGRRAGLADSRRRGLGPAYHGPLPEAMRAERSRDGGPVVSTEPVPGDVRATMRDVLGIDVGDRLVHRGPAVSAEAESMGAQAFTRDGQIYLHDDVGPLDQPRGRATVAHELTHAAQQIVQGVLHDEATEAGRALEAHAQRVEQFVRGDGGAVKPSPDLLHARATPSNDQAETDVVSSAQQMMREMINTGLAKPDGSGGIVFTMPPSSMTASAGTQRLAGDTPTAHAAGQTHWDPLGTFGNTLSQGLGNDMLGIAGSLFGFSDEFIGQERHGLVGEGREFRREQVTNAFTELRLEHLRRVELTNLNDLEARHDLERTAALDAATLSAINTRVNDEVADRLTLLDAQTALALQRLNERRTTRQEVALQDVPDENFDKALTGLFDNAEDPVMPTEDELLNTLSAPPATGRFGGMRPGGGMVTTPRPGTSPTGTTPTGTTPTGTTPTGTTPTGTTPTGTTPTGTTPAAVGTHPTGIPPGTGPGTEPAPEQHWRTDATMGGRFQALGAALGGDIANAEIGFFGSLLGFDSEFEQGLHDEVDAQHGAAAAGTTTAPHTDPAHPDAAAAAAHTAAASHPGAAHETVDRIVGDPYALDELATRLYPTIRSRLRQELLVDRERAGLLADFR
jgi:hypothetical protein